MPSEATLIELTVEIVASYVAGNSVPTTELPALISSTHTALLALYQSATERHRRRAAVPIDESVCDDYLVCLEDGRKLKSLKGYLKRQFGMTPDEYRAKWSLPADYPMVAPAYSALRSSIAKRNPVGVGKLARDDST